MPLLERTPPSKVVTPSTSQAADGVPSSPSRFTRARASVSTNGVGASNEFPSLEDMARPHIQNRQAAAAARPTPLRSKPTSRVMPGSASRPPNGTGAGAGRGVPTSLPRPNADRAGTLYPSVGAAAKRAGNLASRVSLTGLEAARATHVQGTPNGVAKAREAARAGKTTAATRQTSHSEEEDVRLALGAEVDVEAGKLPGLAKGVIDLTDASVEEAEPKVASTSRVVAPSPMRTPVRNARAAAAVMGSAKSSAAKRRQSPRRSPRKEAVEATPKQTQKEVEEEFARRIASMEEEGNPFADSKRADMRKSTAVPSAASTSAAAAAAVPQTAFERQVELALAEGENPFKRRNNAMRESLPASAFAPAPATPPISEPPSQQATPKAAAAGAPARAPLESIPQPIVELQAAPAPKEVNNVSASASVEPASVARRSPEQEEQRPALVARIYPGVPAATASAAAARSSNVASSPSRSVAVPAFHQAPTYSPSASRKSPTRSGIDSPWRLDPASRADRVLTSELKELRSTLATQAREVERLTKALLTAREDAEGWKAECEGEASAASEAARTKRELEAALYKEKKRREELEVRVLELRVEVDEREWARLTGTSNGGVEQVRDTNIELVVARNEVTYQTHRGHELSRTLEECKAELRKGLRRVEGAEAKVDGLEEENKALRKRLVDEKERRKSIAREGLRVEEERDAALEQAESLREQLARASAGGSDAKSTATALKRAEARVAREEEKREALEAQIVDLKKRLDKAKTDSSSSSPAKTKSKPTASSSSSRKRQITPLSSDEEEEEEEEEPAPAPARKVAKVAPAPKAKVKAAAPAVSSKTFSLSSRKALEPMQGASDAVAPTSDMPYDDEDAGTPSPPPAKRAAPKSKAAVASSSKARYAPVYRDEASGSDDQDDVSEEEEDYAVAAAAAPSNAAHQRKTSNPRKRKSVENDEKRRGALEAEVMATPMVRKVAPKEKQKEKEVEAPAAGAAAGKKKRRLLGGGQNAQAQGFFKWSGGDSEALHPNLDLPMELSPVKPSNPHAMRPPPQASGSRAFR